MKGLFLSVYIHLVRFPEFPKMYGKDSTCVRIL